MLNKNLLALGFTFLTAIVWLWVNDLIADKGWIYSHTSRKIIHIGTEPIYILYWLLFEETSYARYLVSLVPLLITVQFLLIGTGFIIDPSAVNAMSRSGDRR